MDASILNYTVNDNVGEFLSKDKKLYINGDWVDPSSGKSFDVEDPATGKKLQHALLEIVKTLMQQLKQPELHLTPAHGLMCQIMKRGKLFGKLVT